jgi:hypothetical protein
VIAHVRGSNSRRGTSRRRAQACFARESAHGNNDCCARRLLEAGLFSKHLQRMSQG